MTPDERAHISPLIQAVPLKPHQLIHVPGAPIQSIYFPVTAVLSLVSILEDGNSTSIATVGNEGAVGLPAVLGTASEPFCPVVLIPGTAQRMPANVVSATEHCPGALDIALLRYAQTLLDQVAVGMACSRHHPVKQRLASWLLMIGDRIQTNRLPLTHELLGQMLGVGRPSVTLAISSLQEAGHIRHGRCFITIIDRDGLEQIACQCYRAIRGLQRPLLN